MIWKKIKALAGVEPTIYSLDTLQNNAFVCNFSQNTHRTQSNYTQTMVKDCAILTIS
jgi:hypothetical protein